jgi:hypothetical protein
MHEDAICHLRHIVREMHGSGKNKYYISSGHAQSGIALTLQITPSQSKINTSTLESKSFEGSVSLRTLARSAVVVPKLRDNLAVAVVAADDDDTADIGENNALRAAGENARAAVHPRERVMAALARIIVRRLEMRIEGCRLRVAG